MAEIIDDLPVAHTGPAYKYPWDEWLDGRARLLTRGEDFDVDPRSMVQIARAQAYRRGLRFTGRHKGDTVTLQVIRDATS